MATYSIKDIEKLTGIKAHTIRIWEKRYAIIDPDRTNTNIRTYSDDDLKKILNISILNKNGIKISKIVSMSDEEIGQKLLEHTSAKHEPSVYQDELLLHMVNMDEASFHQSLDKCITQEGFENTYYNIVFPFLDKIGVLWQVGSINPAQEHFVSNLIRQKLIVAIDQYPYPKDNKKIDVVLFLPEHDLHELGLLFYHYIVRSSGLSSIYLGQGLPFDDLLNTVKTLKPSFVITSFINAIDEGEMKDYFTKLIKEYPNGKVITTGYQSHFHSKVLPKEVVLLNKAGDLRKILNGK